VTGRSRIVACEHEACLRCGETNRAAEEVFVTRGVVGCGVLEPHLLHERRGRLESEQLAKERDRRGRRELREHTHARDARLEDPVDDDRPVHFVDLRRVGGTSEERPIAANAPDDIAAGRRVGHAPTEDAEALEAHLSGEMNRQRRGRGMLFDRFPCQEVRLGGEAGVGILEVGLPEPHAAEELLAVDAERGREVDRRPHRPCDHHRTAGGGQGQVIGGVGHRARPRG
jgi:hypothetical protein